MNVFLASITALLTSSLDTGIRLIRTNFPALRTVAACHSCRPSSDGTLKVYWPWACCELAHSNCGHMKTLQAQSWLVIDTSVRAFGTRAGYCRRLFKRSRRPCGDCDQHLCTVPAVFDSLGGALVSAAAWKSLAHSQFSQ
ncbi:hypothetical protein EXIGLDRAFT_177362 [Exidia glandulosa HHB12029]|uniref:Uncharacterized protein n=1 Tax=Exidia glandulosa HHB12029 TaxID=1314781 RepID=A0A165N482_EXIGL|nr:hypothetical protein EXIGLDRAFT_177362 [Exidia glandulosa HHB12029]